jgi:hypothetical protein
MWIENEFVDNSEFENSCKYCKHKKIIRTEDEDWRTKFNIKCNKWIWEELELSYNWTLCNSYWKLKNKIMEEKASEDFETKVNPYKSCDKFWSSIIENILHFFKNL